MHFITTGWQKRLCTYTRTNLLVHILRDIGSDVHLGFWFIHEIYYNSFSSAANHLPVWIYFVIGVESVLIVMIGVLMPLTLLLSRRYVVVQSNPACVIVTTELH